MRFPSWFILTLASALGALVLTSGTALAHERRDVGKYQFVVGWVVEPALEGLKNGVSLRVTSSDTGKPVEGLQDTLQVEVTHVPSGKVSTFKLRTFSRDPGHYTADLIPTAPGQYRFRFFGTIEGKAVNEVFVSGERFDSIETTEEVQFPEKLAAPREVEGVVRGAQNAAQQAQNTALRAQASASASRSLALLGIGLGALGLALGVGALGVALRRR